LIAGFLFFCCLLNVPGKLLAQKNCATVQLQEQLDIKYPQLKDKLQFEKWLQNKIEQRKAQSYATSREEAPVVTLPVVVHIVHKGEAVGVGANLSKAQIDSQIEVLNEDFRRNNADASNTPSVFQPVAADIEVEFVLAKRDPEGLDTDGVTRIKGDQSSYDFADQYELKSQSFWPSEDYLNIWVTDIDDGFIGYAQFPVSGLSGLDGSSNFALTDGVVVDFRAFGSVEKYPPASLNPAYNLGRTATHEVGHFLGLRHTWGDGGCGVDDFCADTPLTDNSHNGLSVCTFPTDNNGCGSNDMFQNYMAFTDDQCMNLFTLDQKARMRTVLDESPRRASLVISNGDEPPVVALNNLGIRNILAPRKTECSTIISPTLEIRNYGTNQITAATLRVSVDGLEEETRMFALDLNNLDIDTVEFDPIELFNPGSYQFDFEILTVNGSADPVNDNDFQTSTITIADTTTLPELLDFESSPDNWITNNLDGLTTWEITNAPFNDLNNQALKMDFFNYFQEGAIDIFQSPSLDFSETDANLSILSFNVAYANFTGVSDEGLLVTISETCADPLMEADTIFYKTGLDLATVTSGSDFTPTGADDWRRELIDISEYNGSETVQISFIAVNKFGNNLYLDNIGIVNQDIPDIGINQVLSPSPVTCLDNNLISIEIINSGIVPIGSFEIEYAIDNGPVQSAEINLTDSLLLSDKVIFDIQSTTFSEGAHQLYAAVLNPNDSAEVNTDNNVINYTFIIDDSNEKAPIKETFEDFSNSNWVINNPDQQETWQTLETSKGTSIALLASSYNSTNQLDWLVSPTIDLTNSSNALLNFDLAYALASNGTETLRVLASTDCGESYDELVLNLVGENLATTTPTENLLAIEDSVWRNVNVNLNQFRDENELRLAFVSTANNGNNIYLDNIQLFTTETDNLNKTVLYPNPNYGELVNLAFSLDQKEVVTVTVMDRTGKKMLEKSFPNTLNQTYEIDLTGEANGLYFIKVTGESFSFTRRLMWLNNN